MKSRTKKRVKSRAKKNVDLGYTLNTNTEDPDHIGVEIIVSKPQAQAMTRSFWNSYSKNMKLRGFRPGKIPISEARKRKIPIDGMMGELYSQYANIKFSETSPRKVILTADHVVVGTNVKFNAWLEPAVQVTREQVDGIFTNIFRIPNFDMDKYIEGRIIGFTKMHPYLRNKEDDKGGPLPAQENDTVEISVHCMVDGEEYKDGCEDATRIRLVKGAIHPESLYDRLLGALPGGTFTIETKDIPPSWGAKLAGKTIQLDVKVIRVYSSEDAEVDQDMAISAGYKTIEEWKTALRDSATRQANAGYEMIKRQLVLSMLLKVASIDNFPDRWLDEKVKELKDDNNPDPRSRIHEVAKQITILKKVGQLLDVEYDDADQISVMRDEAIYAQKVLSILIEKAKFEHADPTPTKALEGDQRIAVPEQST